MFLLFNCRCLHVRLDTKLFRSLTYLNTLNESNPYLASELQRYRAIQIITSHCGTHFSDLVPFPLKRRFTFIPWAFISWLPPLSRDPTVLDLTQHTKPRLGITDGEDVFCYRVNRLWWPTFTYIQMLQISMLTVQICGFWYANKYLHGCSYWNKK